MRLRLLDHTALLCIIALVQSAAIQSRQCGKPQRCQARTSAAAEAHVTAVSATTFVAGAAAAVMTADTRGRVVLHNVSAYLSLTALLAGAPLGKHM